MLIYALISSLVSAFAIIPPYQPPINNGPSFASDFWGASNFNHVPMYPVDKISLDLTKSVQANFWHWKKDDDTMVGIKLQLKTNYPTYNLNNNGYVFFLIDYIHSL